MRVRNLFVVCVLLICPLAFCYGQLSFSGVNGEKGYAALRGEYRWEADNGWVFVPEYGYYRRSDKEEDEAGSTSRYGLLTAYDITDQFTAGARVRWIPQALGFQSAEYSVRGAWRPFYRWGVLKEPELYLSVGQNRYDVYSDAKGVPLARKFSLTETFAHGGASTWVKNLRLQGVYEKVIKYSSQPEAGVTANWADIPFMVAVIRGFVKEAAAVHVSYPTRWLTPYASMARYKYADKKDFAVAVSGGFELHFWDMNFRGGVEIFEPKRQENRRTYFSMSVEMNF